MCTYLGLKKYDKGCDNRANLIPINNRSFLSWGYTSYYNNLFAHLRHRVFAVVDVRAGKYTRLLEATGLHLRTPFYQVNSRQHPGGWPNSCKDPVKRQKRASK